MGVHGLCLGGATGEYPHFQARERAALIRRAARQMPRNRALLVGIGGQSMRRVIKLGRVAIDEGSEALLLPAPMFYRYEQDDLRAYCTQVSRELQRGASTFTRRGPASRFTTTRRHDDTTFVFQRSPGEIWLKTEKRRVVVSSCRRGSAKRPVRP
jgi:hypothetical protein